MMKSVKKTLIVVQARTGSRRLPGKIMMPLAGKPLLIRMIERISLIKTPAEIVVATTNEPDDDSVVKLCKENGINIFRGSTNDLLERHYKAGIQYDADIIVKIPSDCPLISSDVIDKVLDYYFENEEKYDFVSNLHPASYPDGNDVEIMPMQILEQAFKEADKDFEREHTTPFIWERPERFRIGNVKMDGSVDLSKTFRFTIDHKEDYNFIRRVYDELHEKKSNFDLEDILDLLKEKPEIKKINEMHAGEYWYKNHPGELRTI